MVWGRLSFALGMMALTCCGGIVAASDGPTDANGVDAAVTPSDPDAGFDPRNPCSTTHAFCDDFDHGRSQTLWSPSWSKNTLSLTSDASVSSPNALLAHTSETRQIAHVFAEVTNLNAGGPRAPHGLRCWLDMRLDGRPASPDGGSAGETSDAYLFQVHLYHFGLTVTQVGWVASPDGSTYVRNVALDEASGAQSVHVNGAFPLDVGVWQHVTLTIDGSEYSLAASSDAGTLSGGPWPVVTADGLPPDWSSPQLFAGPESPVGNEACGTYCDDGTVLGWRVLYDNIVCDFLR